MPFGARFESPVVDVICHLFGVSIFPFLSVNHRRNQRTDVVAVAEHLFSCFNHKLHSVHPELSACFAFMNFGIYVKGCEKLVQRGSGSVHHECIVHSLMRYIAVLAFNVGVFLVNLGGHGEAGLLLVDRLGDEDAGIFRSQVQKQGRAVLHHGDELFIAYPCGVEENVVAEVADFIHYLAGIVDAAVVGAQLDDSQADRSFSLGFYRILFSHQFPDVIFIEAVFRNAADGAEGISFCFQIYRSCAGQYQSAVVNGLMVVSVVEDDIARSEDSVQHHLVGRGSAVQYEVCLVGVVYPGCMLLGCQSRAFMNEEVPHGYISVAQISAEGIFAEEIIECTACRVLAEESAALMAWAVKLGVSVFHVFFQILEEWGQYFFFIMGSSAFNLAAVEIVVRFIQVDDPVYPADDIISHWAFLGADEKDRNGKGKNHFLLEHIGIGICNDYGTYIGEVGIIDVHRFAGWNGSENFESFVRVSNL